MHYLHSARKNSYFSPFHPSHTAVNFYFGRQAFWPTAQGRRASTAISHWAGIYCPLLLQAYCHPAASLGTTTQGLPEASIALLQVSAQLKDPSYHVVTTIWTGKALENGGIRSHGTRRLGSSNLSFM